MESNEYRFDGWTLSTQSGELVKAGKRTRLQTQPLYVLKELLARPGQLVTREELIECLWPNGVVEFDTGLNSAIRRLRGALGDDADAPRYIETIPRRGYRFIGRLDSSEVPTPESQAATGAEPPAASARSSETQSAPYTTWAALVRKTLRQRSAAYLTIAGVVVVSGMVLSGKVQWTGGADASGSVVQIAERSLAVLPFVNMSADPDNEHFSDGISEEILNRLGRFEDLRVLARTSSFAFKGSGLDVSKLSDLLGVRYVLEGSVRQDGKQVRITAQLVDRSGFRVWSDSYERERGGIFAIQDEIASAVAASIVPRVSPLHAKQSPPDAEAYRHYLIGREILQKRLPRLGTLAPERLQRAIEIDPQFAEAHAELAIVLAFTAAEATTGYAEQLDRAQREIDTALSLQPGLARAHAAQGLLLQARRSADRPASEAALRQALALDPNMVDARNWLANLLSSEGRYDAALAEWERTARLDPLAPAVNANIASDYSKRGLFSEAEQRLLRLLEVPQPALLAYWSLMDLYFATGRLVEANQFAKRQLLSGVVRGSASSMPLVSSYARLGLWGAAEYWQDRLERLGTVNATVPLGRFEMLRLEGRYADAVAALRTLVEPLVAESGDVGPNAVAAYGTGQALAGDYAAAIQTLEPLNLDIEASLLAPDGGLDAGQALAWAYLQSGDDERAERNLEAIERIFHRLDAAGRLHQGDALYLFAQNAVLAGDRDLAIDRLRQAVEAGWRDYYRLVPDPRWQSLRDDPA